MTGVQTCALPILTINMRCGQAVGDEVLVVFAELLRTLTRAEDLISRVDGERFGVLLPGVTPREARILCQPVIDTLAAVQCAAAPSEVTITASGGIGAISHSLDSTIRRAELALFFAKASGRGRLEIGDGEQPPALCA